MAHIYILKHLIYLFFQNKWLVTKKYCIFNASLVLQWLHKSTEHYIKKYAGFLPMILVTKPTCHKIAQHSSLSNRLGAYVKNIFQIYELTCHCHRQHQINIVLKLMNNCQTHKLIGPRFYGFYTQPILHKEWHNDYVGTWASQYNEIWQEMHQKYVRQEDFLNFSMRTFELHAHVAHQAYTCFQ